MVNLIHTAAWAWDARLSCIRARAQGPDRQVATDRFLVGAERDLQAAFEAATERDRAAMAPILRRLGLDVPGAGITFARLVAACMVDGGAEPSPIDTTKGDAARIWHGWPDARRGVWSPFVDMFWSF